MRKLLAHISGYANSAAIVQLKRRLAPVYFAKDLSCQSHWIPSISRFVVEHPLRVLYSSALRRRPLKHPNTSSSIVKLVRRGYYFLRSCSYFIERPIWANIRNSIPAIQRAELRAKKGTFHIDGHATSTIYAPLGAIDLPGLRGGKRSAMDTGRQRHFDDAAYEQTLNEDALEHTS